MIEDTFLKLKSNLELDYSFGEIVSRQHNAVRSVIENNSLQIKSTKLIGSMSRQTRIQPRKDDAFDVDILVVMGEFNCWAPSGGITSQMAMNSLHSAVRSADRYAKMEPEQDHPAVTFGYANNVTVELVPAYLDMVGASFNGTPHLPTGRAYWVPGPNNSWQLADYDYEADYISSINRSTHGLFIPTVKMLKAVKRWHFPSMKSYHLEVIAADAVPKIIAECASLGVKLSYPLLVATFLFRLEDYLSRSWGIPGSLSPTFMLDLTTQATVGVKASWLREQANKAYFANTNYEKHALWRTIFGEVIPQS
jgi:hypothetical protein